MRLRMLLPEDAHWPLTMNGSTGCRLSRRAGVPSIMWQPARGNSCKQEVPRLKSPQPLSCEHWTPASSFNPLSTDAQWAFPFPYFSLSILKVVFITFFNVLVNAWLQAFCKCLATRFTVWTVTLLVLGTRVWTYVFVRTLLANLNCFDACLGLFYSLENYSKSANMEHQI